MLITVVSSLESAEPMTASVSQRCRVLGGGLKGKGTVIDKSRLQRRRQNNILQNVDILSRLARRPWTGFVADDGVDAADDGESE